MMAPPGSAGIKGKLVLAVTCLTGISLDFLRCLKHHLWLVQDVYQLGT